MERFLELTEKNENYSFLIAISRIISVCMFKNSTYIEFEAYDDKNKSCSIVVSVEESYEEIKNKLGV